MILSEPLSFLTYNLKKNHHLNIHFVLSNFTCSRKILYSMYERVSVNYTAQTNKNNEVNLLNSFNKHN